MGKQRLTEAAGSRSSSSEVTALFGGDFKEPDMARLADIISVVVMHKSNNT
jgi:hypothetical protein